jgi:dTDP-4-dehydrorhamnose 3,5-epimerase-like enzyme
VSLAEVRWIDLPNKVDERGELTFMQGGQHIPFPIERVFYVYHVSDNAVRACHSHRATKQFVISIAGTFMLDLTDGYSTNSYEMNNPKRGIYVPPMIWDRLYNFSQDAVCLVLASTRYDESDYIRDWQIYLNAVGKV